jgi:hypothetical protein
MKAPNRIETTIDTSGARESWFDTVWTALHDAIVYAESAQKHTVVSDIGGIRRALDRARAHFQLAKEAVKKIEELDAEAARAGSVAQ